MKIFDRLFAFGWFCYIVGIATVMQNDLTAIPKPYIIWDRIQVILVFAGTMLLAYFAGRESNKLEK